MELTKGAAERTNTHTVGQVPRSAVAVQVPRQSVPSWVHEIPLITAQAEQKMAPYLASLRKGRATDLRSPLYGGAPRDEIISRWEKILYPKIADYPLLLDFERSNAAKRSPISIILPYEKRAPQVESYFTNHGGEIDEDTLALACDAVLQFTGMGRYHGRLRPLSIEAACERLPANTGWGLPFLLRGVEVKKAASNQPTAEPLTEKGEGNGESQIGQAGANVTRIDNRGLYLELARAMSADLDHPGWGDPCMLYWRGDLSKDPDPKQRVVWGYPHAVSILESQFYPVLTDLMKGQPGFAAWTDLTRTEAGVFAVLDSSDEDHPTWAFDASAFDQHLSEQLIDAVSERIVIPCFQKEWHPLLRRLSRYSKECGLVTPDGVRTGRHFNRPSGSGGTNFLDSFENLVMHAAVLLKMGYSFDEVVRILKQVMGDDAVFETPDGFEVDLAKALYEKLFGTVVNIGKEELSSLFTSFCKRLYQKGQSRSWASTCRAVLKAVSYEGPRPAGWSSYVDTVRWLMQGCPLYGHPAFDEWMQFMVEGDTLHGMGSKVPGGPLQLFKLAGGGGTNDLDQLLGLKAWAGEYHGYNTKAPSELPTVRWIMEHYPT